MARYTLFFRGAPPVNAAEGRARQPQWNDWFHGLGDRVVDRGATAKSLGIAGQTSNLHALPLTTGYAVIEADSETEAMKVAESCPVYQEGGIVEVARYVDPATILPK